MKKLISFGLINITSLILTLWSSSIEYLPRVYDGYGGKGKPFSSIESGGIGGEIITDNYAIYKNFIFWFVLVWFLTWVGNLIYKKLKKTK